MIVGAGITGLLTAYLYGGPVTLVDMGKGRTNSHNSLWTVIPNLCGDLRGECESSMKYYGIMCEKFKVHCSLKAVIRVPPRGGETLDSQEVGKLEPLLRGHDGELVGEGLFIQGDDFLNALMERIDGKFVRARVVGLLREEGVVSGVKTDRGRIWGSHVILTLGHDPLNLLGNFGINVRPLKGHVVEAGKLGMRNILMLEDRLGVEGPESALLNGDSQESSDPSVNNSQVERTVQVFKKYLRVTLEVREVRVGFRAVSPDGRPLLMRPLSNVAIATGFRFGWALAPHLARETLKVLGLPQRVNL